MERTIDRRLGSEAGFSLVELLVSVGVTLVITAAAMEALTGGFRTNGTVLNVTEMNRTLRVAMDMMNRDLLQVGQGLPGGRTIPVPNGGSAQPIRLPGPPTTAYEMPPGTTSLPAVIPGPGRGPTIDGTPTDIITLLAADGAFTRMHLTNIQATRFTVANASPPASGIMGTNISNGGPDDILPGQLIMLEKGSNQALVQVISVAGQVVNFGSPDSLRLNQPGATGGNSTALLAAAPSPDNLPNPPSTQIIQTTATRIQMITYYLDNTTSPGRPRLVRRVNNGNATTFNNTLGAVLAFDVTNLQISYDLSDGGTNPTNVKMTQLDQDGFGACQPAECGPGQIRKINLELTSAGRKGTGDKFFNTLRSQVSLRSMSLVDRYR